MRRAFCTMAAAAAVLAAGCGPVRTTTQPVTSPTPSPLPTGATTLSPAPPSTSPATATPSHSQRPTPTATAAALPAWLRGRVVTRLPTSRHVVALTFDCGAGAQGAVSILATLAREHVLATFFATAGFASNNPGVIATAAGRGYVLGDHTVTHPHLPQLSDARVVAEVTGGATAISSITRRSPRPWFRFPYGEYDARTLGLVHGLGYGAIGWTIDTLGYKGTSGGTEADVVRRVRTGLTPGAIVLMHVGANPDDHTTYDADALPAVIAAIRAAGYDFITVAGPS